MEGRRRGFEGGRRRGFEGGRRRGFEGGRRMPQTTPTAFHTSQNGTQFEFPRWEDTEKDSTLLSNFGASIKCIGGYSEDEERKFSHDKSYLSFLNMKYLPDRISKEKKVNLDLTIGEEEAEDYTGNRLEGFHNFLSWILSNEEEYAKELGLDEEALGSSGKFVFMKNLLSSIATKYHSKGEHSFHAVCVDGVIYLMNVKKTDNTYPDARKLGIWGHKFEQLMTISHHTKDAIISNWDYRCVLSSKLGQHQLIYSCSIDCVNPDKYDETMEDCSALVYLKCSYDNPRNVINKSIERYKMFNWCLELILTEAPNVVVGFRDESGMVNVLKLYEKNDFIQNGKGYWDFGAVFVFLHRLLSFVRERTESKPGTVFHFLKQERSSYYSCSEDKLEDFLPDWFRESFRKSS